MTPMPDNDPAREEQDPKAIQQDVFLMNAQMLMTD